MDKAPRLFYFYRYLATKYTDDSTQQRSDNSENKWCIT
jgi:hypothetical protein